MKVNRSHGHDSGGAEKMSPFERINSEFGAWNSSATANGSQMVKFGREENAVKACRAFNSHAPPRHSRIDKFIESLDDACDALPTPLIGAGSNRPPRASQEYLHYSPQHPHSHCKFQPQREESLRLPANVVKERTRPSVKFADEVIEIGAPIRETVTDASELPRSKRHVREAKELVDRDARVGDERFEGEKRTKKVKAATVMQSRYRGFKVRRGQPLKYLLVVGSVKHKLEELKQQFNTWKIAAWFPTDFTERVTMTESVMDLLLQLDTLQGVPVIVREFRKIVARDVINFQEEVDGFLYRNSKHGVLFDQMRPDGNGANYPKSSKAIKNRVVSEPNMVENVSDSNPNTCGVWHVGNPRERVKSGNLTSLACSVSKHFEPGTDCQSKVPEGMIQSTLLNDVSNTSFVSWVPDAQFDEVSLNKRSRNNKQVDTITGLKKCMISTGSLDIYVPPNRKKKSLGVRFESVKSQNRDLGKEYMFGSDQCPHAPTKDSSAWSCSSAHAGCMTSDGRCHHPAEVLSWDLIESPKLNDSSESVFSMSKDFRIANMHENLEDVCGPRHLETLTQPDYSAKDKREADFPHVQYQNTEKDNNRSNTEQSLSVKGESLSNREGDPYIQAETGSTESNMMYRVCWFQSQHQALVTNIESMPGNDFRDGKPVPLFTIGQKEIDLTCPVRAVHHKSSPKDNFGLCRFQNLSDSLKGFSSLIENEIDATQGVPAGLGGRDGKIIGARVCIEDEIQFCRPQTTGLETLEGDHQQIISTSENMSGPVPTESIHKGSSNYKQPHVDAEVEIEGLCTFDDLETISSCTNCAAFPPHCPQEPWDYESSKTDQKLHQTYALKGLVTELDNGFGEMNGEDARHFEAGFWKEEPWKSCMASELQPCRAAVVTLETSNDKRGDTEARKDDVSWNNKALFEKEAMPEETLMTSATPSDMNKSTGPEGKPLGLPGMNHFLDDDCVASDNITVVANEVESQLLLSKLLEDNKRLKELLKEVMKWNTVQASAMLTLNDRLEIVESKK